MNEIIGNFAYRGDAGIVVWEGCWNNTISDNTVFSNQWEGIGLHSTDNNTISGNDLFDNNDGIVLFEYSYRNNISTNEIHNNDWAGIVIGMDCDNNIIKGNMLYENNVGIRFADLSNDNTIEDNRIWSHFTGGILIVNGAENVFDNNTILSSGLYGVSLIDSRANSFLDNSISGCPYGVYLENSRNNTLLNNTVNDAIRAFQLQYSSNNRLENNTAENTSEQLETSAGFRLIHSPHNELLRNNVSHFDWGFSLKFSSDNTLFHNRAYQCEKAFRIVSSSYNLLDSNRAGNSAYGIYLSDAQSNTLSDNIIDALDGIENSVFTFGYGIYLTASNNNTIRGNDVSVGISGPESLFATGAYLSESDDNKLSGNTVLVSIDVEEIVYNYGYGFNLSRCHRNNLSDNDVELYITGHMFNYGYGFHFSECEDNTFSGNTAEVWVWALVAGQSHGYGISLSISLNNTLLGNDVIVHAIAAGIGSDVDAYGYGISLEGSDENSLSGNTIEIEVYANVFFFSSGTASGYGIFLFDCENNVMDDNFVDVDVDSSGDGTPSELGYGFYLSDCDSNIVTGNDIWFGMHGIYLTTSSNNLMFHNNLVSNAIQAQDILSENGNYWYHPILLEGNYWSDYPGEDIGTGAGKHAIEGDGIGDTFIPWPGPNYDYYPFTDKILAPPLVYQDLELGVAIVFNDITESGSTAVEIPDSVPDPSAGFLLGDNFYSITTTVEFEGIIEIGISYDESDWTNENFVRIMHYNETTGLWEDITTWIDTENNIAYGVISGFSFFALMEIIDHDAPISSLSIDPVYYEVPIYYASSTSTISISAIDVFSGLHHIEYRIDGADWTTFIDSFAIIADGQHTLEFRGIDNVGNVETTNIVTVVIDATRVTFTGSLTGVYSDLVYAEATLIELATQQPLAGRELIISIGTDSIVTQTGTNGIASGVILLTQPSGTVQCTTTFASDGEYLASSDSLDFTILKETAFTEYTGSTVVPETAGAITLRATVFDEADGNWGDIALIAVTFRIYAAPIMDLDLPQYTFGPYMVDVTENKGIGVAITSIPNLPANSYVVYIVIESIHNDYYTGDWSQGVVLTVYEPTGDFVTGGGWLYDSDGKRANFGFNVKYKKNGLPGGQSIYVYREGDWEYLIKSNAWLGMAIEENHAFFEGKCTVQKFNIKTGELVWDEGNYQFRVDVWDNDEDGGVDVYQIRVLDKNGLVFYDAGFDPLGYLEGGNVIIHRDPKN